MKFLDQSLFEVCALTLAGMKSKSDDKYTAMKAGLYELYHPSYPGDNLWFSQLATATEDALRVAKTIAAGNETKLLLIAAEVRKQLNDDLAPKKNGIMQKIGFGGTSFTKSHPAPSSRPEIAAANFKVLLVRLNASDYMGSRK
jgi:hypothetical protein